MPRFDRNKRYVNRKGQRFGKGVWYDDNGKILQPGFGRFEDSSRIDRTVTQYNTDGTISAFSWEDWVKKNSIDHEFRVLQNDRRYAIPFIPDKKVTISIDKNSPTRKNDGAVFSENMLDSIAINAKKAGLSFGDALGIVAQESTFGNGNHRGTGQTLLPWLPVLNQSSGEQKDKAEKMPYQGFQSPSLLISNWKQREENPYAEFFYDGKGNVLRTSKSNEYYDEYFRPHLVKGNRYHLQEESPLQHGFRNYKEHPKSWNYGDSYYQNKVAAQKKELIQYSPEIKEYMRKHGLHSYGGPLIAQANVFGDGGSNDDYNSWKKQIRDYKGIIVDGDNTYDYERFYAENPDVAWSMLNDNPEAHFTDRYKTPYHPTYSDESLYSKSPFVQGGHWKELLYPTSLGQKWNYQLSPSQITSNWDIARTLDYAANSEDDGLYVTDNQGRYPIFDGTVQGGVLPSVNVSNYNEGGSLNTYKSWNNLSIKEKSEMMKVAIRNGVTNLADIKAKYNEFAEGGNLYSGVNTATQKIRKKSVYDIVPELFALDGVKVKVTSGYRPGAVTKQGNPSNHSFPEHAMDLVGNFDEMRKVIYDPNSHISRWMLANNFGPLFETTPEIMAKTGATGKHVHFDKGPRLSRQYATEMRKLGQPYQAGNYREIAKQHIRQNEGWSATPYADGPNGWRSVGYDFNDSGFRAKYPGGIANYYAQRGGITKAEAERELDWFLNNMEASLRKTYGRRWDSFSDNQKAAIMDTAYQRPASVDAKPAFYAAVMLGNPNAGNLLGVKGFDKRNADRRNLFSSSAVQAMNPQNYGQQMPQMAYNPFEGWEFQNESILNGSYNPERDNIIMNQAQQLAQLQAAYGKQEKEKLLAAQQQAEAEERALQRNRTNLALQMVGMMGSDDDGSSYFDMMRPLIGNISAYGGHLYDGESEPTQQMKKRKNYETVFTGDIDSLTFKDNNPWDAYLGNERLDVEDTGIDYTYRSKNGKNVWRVPKSQWKDANPYQNKYEQFLPTGYSKEDVDKLVETLGYNPESTESLSMTRKEPELQEVYPEFAALTMGRGLGNGALKNTWNALNTAGDAAAETSFGRGATSLLTNPYFDAGLTSYFGAHGLNDVANGNANAWTALEVMPLLRVGKAAYEIGKPIAKDLYDNGILWDRYTTFRGRFGNYGNNLLTNMYGTAARRFGLPDKARIPADTMRKISEDVHIDSNGLVDFSGEKGYNGNYHINVTTDRPVVSHSAGNWDRNDLYIFPTRNFLNQTEGSLKSIEPSDMFANGAAYKEVPKNVTLVSGDINALNKAKEAGMQTLSSPRLRKLYKRIPADYWREVEEYNRVPESQKWLHKMRRNAKYNKEYQEYSDEVQRLQSQRGTPTLADYKLLEEVTGLKSGVAPLSEIENAVHGIENMKNTVFSPGGIQKIQDGSVKPYIFPNGREVEWSIKSIFNDLESVKKSKYNNVFYDPTSHAEINWRFPNN